MNLTLLSNFEFLLQDISNGNPKQTLLLGDYNAQKYKLVASWYCNNFKEFNLKLPQLFTGSNN